MAERKPKVFKVKTKDEGVTRFVAGSGEAAFRLVRAKTEAQVNAHIALDFNITQASPDDIHEAGKNDIEIEEAGE